MGNVKLGYIRLHIGRFQGCHTHLQSVTGHEAMQWPGVVKVAFPGGFLHSLLPVDHIPSSLRFLPVNLTACVCGHLEKDIECGHLEKAIYPS